MTLDPGQRALVLGFTSDRRRLVVGVGPAGAGKTMATKAKAQAWRTTGRRVIPLAPSATAAEVLGDELGCRAENLHKFQHAHCAEAAHAPRGRQREVMAAAPLRVSSPWSTDIALRFLLDMSGRWANSDAAD